MGVLPIETARLRLRVMRPADAPALFAYRNDEDVARYQEWPLPFTAAMADELLHDQEGWDDVQPGVWVQIAVEHDGRLVGDVAVGLDDAVAVADIGYTLAPAEQGNGFASEAVEALVDALFARGGVRRIVASLDPANWASMRVIEPLGFRCEGLAREGALVRGEWVDDLRFALLRSEREAWSARELGRPERVELVELRSDLMKDVTRLATFRFQEVFVAPMAGSLAQALVPPDLPDHPGHRVVPWCRAIVADGEVAGFLMLSAVTEHEPVPYLWRLLIDRRHQRRGIGERAVHALADVLRAEGHRQLLVSYVDRRGGPAPFYARLGFVPTGDVEGEGDHQETVARLEL